MGDPPSASHDNQHNDPPGRDEHNANHDNEQRSTVVLPVSQQQLQQQGTAALKQEPEDEDYPHPSNNESKHGGGGGHLDDGAAGNNHSAYAISADVQQAQPSNSATTTTINGRGIWNSWTRNFSTPLLALLDLLDNCFDATTLRNTGRIYIDVDWLDMKSNQHHDEENDRLVTGITIFNNSVQPIKPLRQVLEVYTSLKGATADSIGENGVGLKQGCATLSDTSFCVVKRRDKRTDDVTYELGVLALQLQSRNGCSLPSYTLQSSTPHDLHNELMTLFDPDGPAAAVGDCVRHYSGPSHNLERGVQRLVRQFTALDTNGWEQYHDVFGLIVHHLKHGGDGATNNETPTDRDKDSLNDGSKRIDAVTDDAYVQGHATRSQLQRVTQLLNSLAVDLPFRYLHIPTTGLDVRVAGQSVNFNYWQPRLVELAQFDLNIDKSRRIQDDPLWKDRHLRAPEQDNGNHSYLLRVYMGFDALRVCNDKAQKSATLYLYSRQSGRLIRRSNDCRGELGLTSGGTEFCQGLTILVDDCYANLPLNPTKQDVAFGKQANGETHKSNLNTWLSAAVRLYYTFYRDRICEKSKRVLTESLKRKVSDVRVLIKSSQDSFRALSECQFNRFGPFVSSITKDAGTIRLSAIKGIEFHTGADSRLQLPSISDIQLDVKPALIKRRRKTKSRDVKRQARYRNSARVDGEGYADLSDDSEESPIEHYNGASNNDNVYDDGRSGKRGHSREQAVLQSGTKRKRVRCIQESKDPERFQSMAHRSFPKHDTGKREQMKQIKARLGKDKEMYDAATKKKLLFLKQRMSLLEDEKEDLKQQVISLEAAVKRKDKTILKQRQLIDQHAEENDD